MSFRRAGRGLWGMRRPQTQGLLRPPPLEGTGHPLAALRPGCIPRLLRGESGLRMEARSAELMLPGWRVGVVY
jgi:hypothetical protein